MATSFQACWLIGVIALFVTHCACVSSSEGGQRLIKDSLWEPEEGDTLESLQWEGLDPDENSIQSEEPIYGDKITNENDVLSKPPSVADIKGRLLAYRIYHDLMRSRDRLESRQGMRLGGGEVIKRGHGPRGFYGSRGKRFIPGLESLLLAKYYRDAEKWKRQPHSGFHGSRG